MYRDLFAQKKLITFDLDGTTVKSEKVWDAAFRKVAKTMDIDLITTGISGHADVARWTHILAGNVITNSRPIAELVELTQNEFVAHLDQLELTDGFWPLVAELKLLKGLNLALVTNTSRAVTDRVIAQLELGPVFDFILCGNEVKLPKPNPEIYTKTLAHFKVHPKDTLAFEDSLVGCTSATKAGINVVCVWDGTTPKREFPDEVLEFVGDFTPFPGEMDTTYFEDLQQMVKR